MSNVHALVGRDPLEHPDPLFQALRLRRILGAFLRSSALIASICFSLSLNQRIITPAKIRPAVSAPKPDYPSCRPSVRGEPERIDLLGQAMAVVGDDALDRREPVLTEPSSARSCAFSEEMSFTAR
jgi:hypothetical protein